MKAQVVDAEGLNVKKPRHGRLPEDIGPGENHKSIKDI